MIKHGFPLTVFDLSKDAVGKLVAKGATAAPNPAAVAQHVDTIVTMLPSSPHVKSVYVTDANGIVAGLLKRKAGTAPAFLIDSSTSMFFHDAPRLRRLPYSPGHS